MLFGLAIVGTAGAIFAADAGEALEEHLVAAEGPAVRAGLHDHVEAGDLARTLSIVMLVLLAAWKSVIR